MKKIISALLMASVIAISAAGCGYNDALTFSKAFKKKKGLSPLAYRKKAETL